jgi:hypothetical protein
VNEQALAAARRGADFLDRELGPNWEDRIDVATLDLSSGCRCVVGQIYRGQGSGYEPSYFAGCRALGMSDFAAAHCGFVADFPKVDWPDLNEAWLHVLAERAAARQAETVEPVGARR